MRRLAALLVVALGVTLVPGLVAAHILRTGYLELRRATGDEFLARWTMPLENGLAPAVELRLDPSCTALASPEATQRAGKLVRTWPLRCPRGLGGTTVMAQGLAEAQADLLVRVVEADTAHAGRLTPTAPSFEIPAVTASTAVFGTYLWLGVEHMLLGIDHLLFVLALVLLVRDWRRLLATITAFTIAHSVTLGAAVLGFVHLPWAPVEALIALSIAFVAAAIVRGGQDSRHRAALRSWPLAFAFGLLHGLGFAGALSEIGLPPPSIPLALLAFNLGVELGQLAFVVAVLPLLALAKHLPVRWPGWGPRLAPYAIGSVAMFWTVDRVLAFWG